MRRIFPGQVWQNGCTAVKIQDNDGNLELVTFDLNNDTLRFRKSDICSQEKAQQYLQKLNCKYTTKVLATVEL